MEDKVQTKSDVTIFYDGICNLCDWSVKFLMKNDRKKIFSFYSLQSEKAKKMLKPFPEVEVMDGVVLLDGGVIYMKSDAILHGLNLLHAPWKYFYVFRKVPVTIRDGIYGFVASNRYRLFGKKDSCTV